MITCSRCGNSLPVRGSGRYTCPACTSSVRVELFPCAFRPVEQGRAADPVTIDSESSCFHHPAKRATAVCDDCGRFLCALCDLDVDHRHVCPTCVEHPPEGKADPAAGVTAIASTRSTYYDEVALSLGVIPLVLAPCLWPLLIFTALATLYVAIRYRRAPRSVLSGRRWKMPVAVVCALLQLLIVAFFAFSITGAFFFADME